MIARSFRELRTYQLARDGAGLVFDMTGASGISGGFSIGQSQREVQRIDDDWDKDRDEDEERRRSGQGSGQ
jgi:hypothetical protein